MSKRFLAYVFLLTIAIFSWQGSDAWGASNLLINSDFELGASGWTADIWDATGATMTTDSAQYHGGTKSARIVNSKPDDARWLQTVTVKPNTNYRLSGWIKTQNVTHTLETGTVYDVGANLSLYGTYTSSSGLFGTNNWTYASVDFNSGSDTSVKVAARLGYWYGTVTGTAWFDDLVLAEILPVNGVCGSSNGQSLASAPISGFCAPGSTFSGMSGAGPWTWTCAGSDGGTTANCSASATCTPTSLVLYPPSLSFTVPPGEQRTASVTVRDNCGSPVNNLYTTSETFWMTASNSSNNVIVSVNSNGLTQFVSYQGTISIASSGLGMLRVPVTFVVVPYSSPLTVNKAGTGSGTVLSSPSGINCGAICSSIYARNTSVTLTASPDTGSVFAGWSGGGCAGTGNCTLTMNSTTNVTAMFNISTVVPLALPTGIQSYQYPATALPEVANTAEKCLPLGVGLVANGGDTLSLRVKLPQFQGPVDIYLALYVPKFDPANIYFLTHDNGFQPLSQGLSVWRPNVNGPLDETIFGDIPATLLPMGKYDMFVVVAPAGKLENIYIWQTFFGISGGRLVLSPQTKTLSSSTAGLISAVSPDGVTYTFSGSNSELSLLQPGNIISVPPSSQVPYGALRRIVTITKSGNGYVISTAEASLKEAISSGKLSFFKTFSNSDIAGGVLPRSALSPDIAVKSITVTPQPLVLPFSESFGGIMDFSGNLTIMPSLEVNLDFDNSVFDFISHSSVTSTLTYTNPAAMSVQKEVQIGPDVPLGTVPLLGVLYLTPVVRFHLGVDGTVNATFTITQTSTITIDAGLDYDAGAWNSSWNFTSSYNATNPFTEKDFGTFHLKGYGGPMVALKVNGMELASVATHGYLLFEGDIKTEPLWTLYAGYEDILSAGAKFFGFTLLDFHKTDDTRKILLQAMLRPKDVKAQGASSSEIDLAWSACKDTNGDPCKIDGYKIYRDNALLTTTTAVSYRDHGLDSSKTYCYSVTTYTTAGRESKQSDQSCAKSCNGITCIDHIDITGPTSVDVGKTIQLTATARDANGNTVTDPLINFKWVSSDLSIATVDASSGLVSGLKKGVGQINVTESSSKKTATVTVSVNDKNSGCVIDSRTGLCEGAWYCWLIDYNTGVYNWWIMYHCTMTGGTPANPDPNKYRPCWYPCD